MREDILVKHLKNLIYENNKIKDAFIMGVDGLLIAVLDKKEYNQDIAGIMAGVIDAAKRVEDKLPVALSVRTMTQKIIAVPLSENFFIVIMGDSDLNSNNVLELVNKNKLNILGMIENREFSDLFSFRPVKVEGLDI